MAAQIQVVDGRYDGEKYVSIDGPISEGDLIKVKREAKAAILKGNNGVALLLNSDGGDVVEAMKIGKFARDLLATTFVYGNTLYKPGTPSGDELEQYGKTYGHMKFGLRPIKSETINKNDLVSCLSACVIIFYGGVSRHTDDNNDYRNGFKNGQHIPVIGIHRPYFEQSIYASLSPGEAKEKYVKLEKSVRDYLQEMGAPTSLIDRMFRKASNEIDLIPSEQFKDLYNDNEPFIDEWLIAKCGGFGPAGALSGTDLNDYQLYQRTLKSSIDKGLIKSTDDFNRVTPPGISVERIKQLDAKIQSYNSKVMSCNEGAIRANQIQWANKSN